MDYLRCWNFRTPRLVLAALTLLPGCALAQGVAFDGRCSRAVVAGGGRFDLARFTVSAWVRFRSLSGSQVLIDRGGAGELFTLYLYRGRLRMLVEHHPGKYAHASAPAPPAANWTHCAGSYDGKRIRLFVGGALRQEVAAPGRMPRASGELVFGALPQGTRVLDGRLDDVGIWSRVLAPSEVAALASRRGGGVPRRGLVGLWRGALDAGGRWGNQVVEAPGARFLTSLNLPLGQATGYRGIWYANTPQDDHYAYKYSGGLGTYCAKHRPLAIYSARARKTFFCYGGTTPDGRTLLHMVSYFDHESGLVPRPTILLDKGTSDAHDNPVLAIDGRGYLWIFSSSHGTARPSFIAKSTRPYEIGAFEHVLTANFSYPQPYYLEGRGFLFLHTRYGGGRRLYQMTSADGRVWSKGRLLAAVERGHYQVSWPWRGKVGTAFNFHPDPGGLDARTNLYYMETSDGGRTWRDVRGRPIDLPLEAPANSALVHEYRRAGLRVYLKDLAFDSRGRPVILYLTSRDWRAGPRGDPRIWRTAHWNGSAWELRAALRSDNNYDTGALYVERDDLWRIIAPSEVGPQPFNTGGEVAMWISSDGGASWEKVRQLTRASAFNHTYCRKPLHAHPDFYCLWADGNGREPSPSRLYFCNRAGDVFRLPVVMSEPFQRPRRLR